MVLSTAQALQAKYKIGLLNRLLCPDNNNMNFITNFEQILGIQTDEAALTPQPLFGNFSMSSENLVCETGGCRQKLLPRNMTATVVRPLALFDRTT